MIHPPPYLLPWLTCTTYMMERLFAKSQHTDLTVLQQMWETANAWDQQLLSVNEQEQVLHRDIVVIAKEHACWFARTILPRSTYQAHETLFERLQYEPLGNLIFHTQTIQRLSLQYYVITPSDIEYAWLPATMAGQSKELWLRLSVFQVENNELFGLTEILLPDLEYYC